MNMKTVSKALLDEVFYPVPVGYVENVCIRRGIEHDAYFTSEVALSASYKGALADCLRSLIQSVNFSESDKSVGSLSDKQRALIINKANSIYKELGEPCIDDEKPLVIIGG